MTPRQSPAAAGGVTRRAALGAAGGAAALGGALATGAPAWATTPTPGGRTFADVLVRVDQDGDDLRGYGFLTRVPGLRGSQLFSDPAARSAENARFTTVARVTITARSVIPDVLFSVSGQGALTWYYNEDAGASFEDPATFSRGRLVARDRAQFHVVVDLQGPDQAGITMLGELTQRSAPTFRLGGRTRRLGEQGLRKRLFLVGDGRRTNPEPPRAILHVAGNVIAFPES